MSEQKVCKLNVVCFGHQSLSLQLSYNQLKTLQCKKTYLRAAYHFLAISHCVVMFSHIIMY